MKNVIAAAALVLAFAAPALAQPSDSYDEGFRVQEQSNHGGGTTSNSDRDFGGTDGLDRSTTQSITPDQPNRPVQPRRTFNEPAERYGNQGTVTQSPSTDPAR